MLRMYLSQKDENNSLSLNENLPATFFNLRSAFEIVIKYDDVIFYVLSKNS
jgi:hypothetical protein